MLLLNILTLVLVSTHSHSLHSPHHHDRCCRSDEWDFGQDGWDVVTLPPAPVLLSQWRWARGQGSQQGAVKVKGLSLSKGSWNHHSVPTVHTLYLVEFFSSPTFSNPSKWLRQNSWQQQEKQTVGCWALSLQLEISLWKDSLLLTALSTNQRAHQSPSTQSSWPLTLPAVVGLFCLGFLEGMGLLLTGQAAGLGWGL